MLCNTFLSIDIHKFRSELTVNDRTVTDNDYSIDVRLIDQPLCQPSDGFGFTAASAVPDQISLAYSVFLHVMFTAQNGSKLMIARENHGALIINEHELPDDA